MVKAVLHMPEEEVQAVAVEGVAKLMLAGMMFDDAVSQARRLSKKAGDVDSSCCICLWRCTSRLRRQRTKPSGSA
jgi:hypothetical protein